MFLRRVPFESTLLSKVNSLKSLLGPLWPQSVSLSSRCSHVTALQNTGVQHAARGPDADRRIAAGGPWQLEGHGIPFS
ncbi:hypothetical protein EYF80_068291 [Liparis tanakae]|uniref:Uncharacterized protein n=1 Tax=Liparis tanakae TaxID=230148 RepID=A0A4Z2DYT1_9TELE|nr:hypothetical protein EYF80_068291 [Liparis tanakae]